MYEAIRRAARERVDDFTLAPRDGRAWAVAAGAVVRISTPEGPQVGDLNLWNRHNRHERFWASKTRQLQSSHLSRLDRLWSTAPFLRPLATVLADSLAWYGRDGNGARVHDLLGSRCDPYAGLLAGAGGYDFHCHSNLVRAVRPFGLAEHDVHDVVNLFQVTGLDDRGRYFMSPSPARAGDAVELLAEQDLLMALSTCPGGDLSAWALDSPAAMASTCRPLRVQVFRLADDGLLARLGWRPACVSAYAGRHGIVEPDA
ncbi:hypothetical protein CDD83_1155 [Cordyceps sp. RAO-2017]|nr:hypothetical protein CDD83_1155 [Cordyceps sp. RAO-2017]